MFNTKAFISALTRDISGAVLPCFFEEAPTKASFPYSVVNGININDLEESGDNLAFYLDVWADEKKPEATEELEALCDRLRNFLYNHVIYEREIFAAHIGFDNRSDITDGEFDLCHRRLSLSARIFYN